MTNGVARSERAGERTAVHQQVLAGDEAGMRAAQERAGRAELLGGTAAARRILIGLLLDEGLVGHAGHLRLQLPVAAQPVRVHRARSQAVTSPFVPPRLPRTPTPPPR